MPIWEYLAPSDSPVKSDAIFVFGGLDMAVPTRAAELFCQGWSNTVLITGNAGKLTKDVFSEPEARVFRNRMIESGVPESAILLEEAATNTQQNVEFGMDVLARHGLVPQSALLVAKPFLARRCLATFEKHFSSVRVCSCPPSGSILTFMDRPRAEFAERLVAELIRLRDYAVQGFITSQHIPPEVDIAAMKVTEMLH